MTRTRVLVAGVALVLAAAPREAWGQMSVAFHAAADTALGVVPGDTAEVPLRFNSYYDMNRGQFTIHFDPTKLDIVGVIPDQLSTLTVTPVGPGVVRVHGSGYAYAGAFTLFRLQVVLISGVTDGGYLWASPDTVNLVSYGDQAFLYASGIGQVCHAIGRWGDVDANGRIDSRDALITLTAAVGLPVGGFSTAMGDVDADGLVGSRDALMMLSQSIGLTIYTSNRVGVTIIDACPGLSPPGEDLVFVGDTGVTGPQALRRLVATSTTPVTVPLPAGPVGEPRLAANGTSVVYSCYDGSGPQICRAETDGTGFLQLTSGGPYARNADWSPNGLEVAYTAQVPGSIRRVNADGTGDSSVASAFTGQNPYVAWSRTGTQLAYSTSSGLFVVDRYGVGGSIGISPAYISPFDVQRWSPAGDSIAFTTGYSEGIWAVPAVGGTAVGQVRLADMGTLFDWGPQGFVFSCGSNAPGFAGLWLMTSGGQLRRLTRGSDHSPAFRRNP